MEILWNDNYVCANVCLSSLICLVWLSWNFEYSISVCLPGWHRWAIASFVCYVAEQLSHPRQGRAVCAHVCRGEGGGSVMTQPIIAPLVICAPLYTGKCEGVRKKRRQCGSRPGNHYITFRANEFSGCRMLTFCIKELGLKGCKWLLKIICTDWQYSINMQLLWSLHSFKSGSSVHFFQAGFFPSLCLPLWTRQKNSDSAFCSGLQSLLNGF